MNHPKHIAVIGAGVAGLAAAARLAARGRRVRVYERNAYCGGKLGALQSGGYTWDTGPSLFTQPWLLEELFAACGEKASDYLRYQKLDDGTRYRWEDGTRLTAYADHNQLMAELARALPVDSARVADYLSEARRAYEHIGSIFLNKPIRALRTWLSGDVWKALRATRLSYLTQTLHDWNVSSLSHPKLVQLFDRFATYNGSDPYRCPAMLFMIAHLELNEGAYYPEGGMASIPRALEALCRKLGVEIFLETPADAILLSGKAVKGLVVRGEKIAADAVVSNADAFFTYDRLLKDKQGAAAINKQERSSSGIVFYWGVQKSFTELGLHNIFFSDHYRQEFADLYAGKPTADPTLYLNITSKMDAGHAPPGGENWFVLINAPAGRQVDDAFVAATRKAALDKASRILKTDVASLIAEEHTLTPQGIERSSGSYLGALYGTASNGRMAAFARHPNVTSRYRDLFFCGGTVHPGGGIPLCLRSAAIASGMIG